MHACSFFFAAKAQQVDTREQWVTAKDLKGHKFRVHYDKLAICTGSQVLALGSPGGAVVDSCILFATIILDEK